VAVPQSKPFRPAKIPGLLERDPLAETAGSSFDASGSHSGNLDEGTALSYLKDLIATGVYGLDPMLGLIADVARQLTGASGAALAMRKDGAMVCRARSGDLAPVLGAQLSVKTGISGECLRTGKIQHCSDTENDPLVDLEVCRSLGLRSIAALPIRGWRGTNGILEVFSTRPAAFTERHIALLQKLAVLADRARTSRPEGISPAVAPALPDVEDLPSSASLASDDRDVALASPRVRSRPLVLGAVGLVAIAALVLALWLGRRSGNTEPSSANPASVSAAKPSADTAGATTLDVAIGQAPEINTTSKANPGGESVKPSPINPGEVHPPGQKASAGAPVQLASKVDAIAGRKAPANTARDRSLSSGGVAPNVVVKHGTSDSQTGSSQTGSKAGAPVESRTNLRSDMAAPSLPPPIPASAAGQSPLSGILAANVSLPGFGAPVSRGVSGGKLVHRVSPVYPTRARLAHLEGRVILAAVIMEDGSVRDVKVIEGPPLLAESAADAVKDWLYKPYQLDGKPVKNEVRITVDFKLP